MQFGREWTKFAVRFREVSGLENVRLERVDCTTCRFAFAGFVSHRVSAKSSKLFFFSVGHSVGALK